MDCPERLIWSGGFQGWCTWTIAAVIFALAAWPAGAASPAEARGALGELKAAVERAKAKKLDTLHAEVWLRVGPRFLDDEYGKMTDAAKRDDWAAFLLRKVRFEKARLDAALAGKKDPRVLPPIPDYAQLRWKGNYLHLGDRPVLIVTAGNSGGGKGDPRYVGPGDLYGIISAVGATRYDYQNTPIWPLYQKDPKSRRVYDGGWCGHIIKDKWSIGGQGGRKGICVISLDYPPMREAVRQAIVQRARRYKRNARRLARNKILTMDWEFTYHNYDEPTKVKWQGWLKGRYETIAKLNDLWKTAHEGFADVTLPPISSNREKNPAKYYDFGEFNLWRFTDYLLWARKVIRKEVPGYPMCVGGGQPFGSEFWKQGMDEEYLAVTGVDDVWLSETGSRSWGTAAFMDLQHSIRPDMGIMDPEYHGQGCIYPLMFFHGCGSLDLYGWPKKRDSSLVHGWSMLTGALEVRRLAGHIVQFTRPKPQAAILYSRASMIQRHPGVARRPGRRGVQTPYILELEKCYRAGTTLDTGMGFVTSRMAAEGIRKDLKVLIVPGAYFAREDVVKHVYAYARGGGSVVMLPTSFVADEYNRRRLYLKDLGVRVVQETVPKYLAAKARAGVSTPGSEYDFIQGPIAKTLVQDEPTAKIAWAATGGPAKALDGKGIRQKIEAASGRVLAKYDDGSAAVVKIQLGGGSVYYVAMQLDEASTGELLDWVYGQAGVERPFRVADAAGGRIPGLESRTVRRGGGHLTYLFNMTDRSVRASLKPTFRAASLTDLSRMAPARPGAAIALGPYEWCVLRWGQ